MTYNPVKKAATLGFIASFCNAVTIESTLPQSEHEMAYAQTLAEHVTRSGVKGASTENYTYTPPVGDGLGKCIRTTVYEYFHSDDEGEDKKPYDFDGSSVTHQDALPLDTCCHYAKENRNSDGEPLAELVGACPANETKTLLTWESVEKHCLESITQMKWGEFFSQSHDVVLDSKCCEAGQASATDQSDAEKLIAACPVTTVYNCDPDPCTKTVTTFDVRGEGQSSVEGPADITEDDKADICARGIAGEEGHQGTLTTQCPPSDDTTSDPKWDYAGQACITEQVITHYDGRDTEYIATVVPNESCCSDLYPDACPTVYTYNANQPVGQKCKSQSGRPGLTPVLEWDPEVCCIQGWQTGSSALKAACSVSKAEFVKNIDDSGECTVKVTNYTPDSQSIQYYTLEEGDMKTKCLESQDVPDASDPAEASETSTSTPTVAPDRHPKAPVSGPGFHAEATIGSISFQQAREMCAGYGAALPFPKNSDQQEALDKKLQEDIGDGENKRYWMRLYRPGNQSISQLKWFDRSNDLAVIFLCKLFRDNSFGRQLLSIR